MADAAIDPFTNSKLNEFAPAKINLDLHVTGRRDDGLHLLDSLVVFSSTGDRLAIVVPNPNSPNNLGPNGNDIQLEIIGPAAKGLPNDGRNLIVKAARLLAKIGGVDFTKAGTQAALLLEKNLPIASGIGGGSADAAAALRLLNRYWRLHLTTDKLSAIGLQLGADVPVCLGSETCIMSGVGDNIRPVSIAAPFHLLLVNPGIEVSTPEVFKSYSASNQPWSPNRFGGGKRDMLVSTNQHLGGLVDFLKTTKNDLFPAAVKLESEIAMVTKQIQETKGCMLARMSGSGATCFGIYENLHSMTQAENSLRINKNWTVIGGMTYSR
jgi:4-diphosphocytidyl-2-C-methyl-D-erythritol kinase